MTDVHDTQYPSMAHMTHNGRQHGRHKHRDAQHGKYYTMADTMADMKQNSKYHSRHDT